MKIIEAMKRVKANKEKVTDLQGKIGQYCAHLNFETPLYGTDTPNKIKEWLQSCDDTSQENVRLLTAIQKTNIATMVTIQLADKSVTKSIAEWIWRRREYAKLDQATWSRLTDRNLKEGSGANTQGTPFEVKIVRYFDPAQRDKMVMMYATEPHEIDAALEVVNAITDLVE